MKILKSVTVLAGLALMLSSCHRGGTGCPMRISDVQTPHELQETIETPSNFEFINVVEKETVFVTE